MRITFAYDVDLDGHAYRPDETADIDEDAARALLTQGRARLADDDKPAAKAARNGADS